MNKKAYINPDFEFVSFNFEPITTGAITPTPLIDPQNAAQIITLSGLTLEATPSMEPSDYNGVKYYGLEFTEDKFTSR